MNNRIDEIDIFHYGKRKDCKLSIVPKLIYKYNIFLIKILMELYCELKNKYTKVQLENKT